MLESRFPVRELTPFLGQMWATDATGSTTHGSRAERVLPTGSMHLVLRLGSEPLRLYENGTEPTTLRDSVIGGVRMLPFVKDVSRPVPAVGAMLKAGAATLLFGVPADELAGRHTSLDAVWGEDAGLLCEELLGIASLGGRLTCLERRLRERLPTVRALHPGVAQALHSLEPSGSLADVSSVGQAAAESGLSHRRFAQLFREAAGLSPKQWTRLRRFQRALHRAAREPELAWVDLAFELGYSDQPHFAREFREFAGVSPGEYRRLAPHSPNHVPQGEGPFSSRRSSPSR